MKKILSIFALFVGALVFAGCSLVSSTNTNSNTNTSGPVSDSEPWVGEWSMVSEVATIGGETITNPATNKIISFEAGGTFLEDYTQLQGLGACNDTKGEFSSSWMEDSGIISVDVPGSTEVEAPYIDCGEGAGTNAVPRSIASFSYTGDSWEITHDSATDMLTATISGPPGTVTQTFARN